jgi:hypothetical protein
LRLLSGLGKHLQKAGFRTKVLKTRDIDAVKRKLGVPDDLAARHTAEAERDGPRHGVTPLRSLIFIDPHRLKAGIHGCNGRHASAGMPFIKYQLPKVSPTSLSVKL